MDGLMKFRPIWVSNLVREFVLHGAQQSQLFTHLMMRMMMPLVILMIMMMQLGLLKTKGKMAMTITLMTAMVNREQLYN